MARALSGLPTQDRRVSHQRCAIGASCSSLRSQRERQGVFCQRQHIQHSIDFGRSIVRMRKIVAAAGLGLAASQAAAEQIRKRCVLEGDDDLPVRSTDGRQDFDKIQRPIVVDVLDRIVQEKRLPSTPRSRKVHREQKGQTRRPPLAATEEELRIAAVADGKVQGSPHPASEIDIYVCPISVRSKTLIQFL
jgi:hypothetical protein